jgi:hypothetical protein
MQESGVDGGTARLWMFGDPAQCWVCNPGAALHGHHLSRLALAALADTPHALSAQEVLKSYFLAPHWLRELLWQVLLQPARLRLASQREQPPRIDQRRDWCYSLADLVD